MPLPLLARTWRVLVALVVVAGVTAGTLVGDDKWWPFAPMSQYAFGVERDGGVINSPRMEAITVDGERVPVPLTKQALGLERSEIEGQLPSIIADPELLQSVAVLHARRSPDEPRWATLSVENTRIVLESDGTRTRSEETLATWQVLHPEDPERGL